MTVAPVVVESLSKTYRAAPAVEDVSFSIASGRVTALLGRNGAGKTTTLRMVLGLVTPTRGTALVFGHAFDRLPGSARRVGFSMGEMGAIPGATVIADLRACAQTLGLPRARCEQVLDTVGLEARSTKVAQLSTGMRQRHGLAVALLADPELLILDEPASGLDPDGIRWLRESMRSLAREGRTVLLSSHHLAEVEQTVDDVIVLQRTLRFTGTLDALTDHGAHRLEERFFDLVGADAATPSPSAPRSRSGHERRAQR